MNSYGCHQTDKIRVLIVEDSKTVREFLTHIISRDPRLDVAGVVNSAEEALRRFHRIRPDVVSMDIRLPGMNGFEATQRIMAEMPTPIVVVSASVEADDLNISMNALKAGALAVVEKPVGTTHEDYEALSERLCTQLAIMSQVKVVRQRFNNKRTNARNRQRIRRAAVEHTPHEWTDHELRMIGIVSSTGGPKALQNILSSLPSEMPVPIALVQHITTSFHAGFVSWLDSITPLTVVAPRHLEVPQPGTVYVAPADHHLEFDGRRFRLSQSDPVCAERPSGTVLLNSLAQSLGPQAVGVVLTGMGEDGAEGLLRMREAGSFTIAEDASTAVVYGMPQAAVQLGAACETLPLGEIAASLLERINEPAEVS